ncbi:MAG: hypothetical protein JWO56_165, partial [Acidobacteria bacterium]|nr:hypothetical protein [Acidobacteriota bacterium]
MISSSWRRIGNGHRVSPEELKYEAEAPPIATGPVVIVEGSAATAEMLHTFFRVMELEPVILAPSRGVFDDLASDAAGRVADTATSVCRLAPAAVIIDCARAPLRTLDLARELRRL